MQPLRNRAQRRVAPGSGRVTEHPLALAGDRLTVEDHDDGTMTVTYSDKGTGRVCGDCQLCCRLLPVALDGRHKAAG